LTILRHATRGQQAIAHTRYSGLCRIDNSYISPCILWHLLFLFLHSACLWAAMVYKEATAQQGSKAVERRRPALSDIQGLMLCWKSLVHPNSKEKDVIYTEHQEVCSAHPSQS